MWQTDWLAVIIRTVSVYLFIVLAIRLFGKKEIAQLSVIDLVFILLISNSVQNAMVGPDNSLVGGLVAATVLFIVNFVLKFLVFRSRKFGKLLQGEPITLVYEGQMIEKNILRAQITHGEIEAAVREHGVESFRKTNLVVLEADGNISVLSENFHKKTRHIPMLNKK